MASIDKDSRFTTVDNLEPNEVPDGYVIYDQEKNQVHYLNTTAAIAYQLCDGNHTVGEIAVLLKEAFEIDEEVDLEECISNLLEAGLICQS